MNHFVLGNLGSNCKCTRGPEASKYIVNSNILTHQFYVSPA